MWHEFSTLDRALLKDHPKQESAFNAGHKTVLATKEKWSILPHIWQNDRCLYTSLLLNLTVNLPPRFSCPQQLTSGNRTNPIIFRKGKVLFDQSSAGGLKNYNQCLKMDPLDCLRRCFSSWRSFHISKQCLWFCRFLSALFILFHYSDFSDKLGYFQNRQIINDFLLQICFQKP